MYQSTNMYFLYSLMTNICLIFLFGR